MIALMATGNAALVSLIPVEPVRTMAATIGDAAVGCAEVIPAVYSCGKYNIINNSELFLL